MRRRRFVSLLGGLGVLASSRAAAATGAKAAVDIVVVGAGIVGASVAYHLARRGSRVTVIDRDGPASQASGHSFAWINASYPKQPFSNHLLNRLGVLAYRRLQAELGLDVRWGGSIEWFADAGQQARLRDDVLLQQRYGMPTRMVGVEAVTSIEPRVDLNEAGEVAYSESDGAVDAGAAVGVLLSAAQRHGARVVFPCELTGLRVSKGRLAGVETSSGFMAAQRLVLAAGITTHELAGLAGVEFDQAPTPGIIATTAPMQPVLNTVVVAPGVHIHQRHDGRVVMGEQGGPPATESHRIRLMSRPQAFPGEVLSREHGERIKAVAKQFVPALGAAQLESVVIGWRPMPTDGKPVVGAPERFPDLYLAVMHSGVTLAGIVGQLAALELIDGVRSDLLSDFRVERFKRDIG